MSHALLIEVRGVTAGLVVGADRKFRFFSSLPAFDGLDGQQFSSVAEAQRAASAAVLRKPMRAAA